MWNGVTETEKALKELDKEYGVKETEIKLRNPDGKLNPGSPSGTGDPGPEGPLASAVSYISRGAGRIKARFGMKTFYNSEERVVKQLRWTPSVGQKSV